MFRRPTFRWCQRRRLSAPRRCHHGLLRLLLRGAPGQIGLGVDLAVRAHVGAGGRAVLGGHEANAATVVKVIAERRHLPTPNDECRLLAAIGMLLVERVLDRWVSAPGRALDDLIRQEFAALPAVLK